MSARHIIFGTLWVGFITASVVIVGEGHGSTRNLFITLLTLAAAAGCVAILETVARILERRNDNGGTE